MNRCELLTIVDYALAHSNECASAKTPTASCPLCHRTGSWRAQSRLASARNLLCSGYSGTDASASGGLDLITALSIHDVLPNISAQTVDVCGGAIRVSGFADIVPWFAACGQQLRTVADWLPPASTTPRNSCASIYRGPLLPMPPSLYPKLFEHLTREPPSSHPGIGALQHKPAVGDLLLSGDFVYGCCFGGTLWLPGFARSISSDLWTIEGLLCGFTAWLPLRGGHLPVGHRVWLYNGAEWCLPATFRPADIRHYDSMLALQFLVRMWWPTLSPLPLSDEAGIFGCLAFVSGLVHSTAPPRALSGAALVQACTQLLDPLEAAATPSAFGGSSLYLDGGRLARLVIQAWEDNLQQEATSAGLMSTTSVLYVLTSRRHNRLLHCHLAEALAKPVTFPQVQGQLAGIFRILTQKTSLPYDQWQSLIEDQIKCDYEWFVSLSPSCVPTLVATVRSLGLALNSLIRHVLTHAGILSRPVVASDLWFPLLFLGHLCIILYLVHLVQAMGFVRR
ncbi:uncharacterized protein BDW43DRAFT_282744 [Aspergillus alliaceus]|uniref:uncharacterized protein n=1 Tax=Petromyces alliaceus TaxID=209559 RepID=UPI0012A47223|nr:uncharacterized protein BDW43DRAFT_282744 [Aspergillus alliaceus]KAB8231297.1 hypothetical protein BDW43DRAFT_282744 [Aspergillus alliaceus]